MKKITFFFILCFFFVTGFANAEQRDEYLGIKAGYMTVDTDVAGENFSDIPIASLVYGFGITKDFAAEFELGYQLDGGDLSGVGSSGGINISTTAIYGVYRFWPKDDVFLKVKAGALREDKKVVIFMPFAPSVNGTEEVTEVGFSAGVSLGKMFSDSFSGEVGYTMVDEDIDSLNVGINYHF